MAIGTVAAWGIDTPLVVDGPIIRMSKPRIEYSPPRNSFSKMGSCVVLAKAWMYSYCPRVPKLRREACFQ